MIPLPPLDAHAHVDLAISSSELENLGAVVMIATRSLEDFKVVQDRKDLVSVWGVGCHPSLVGVQKAFNKAEFRLALKKTPFVAEVGLDGSSRVSLESQTETLQSILQEVCQQPRIISLHSYGATTMLVEVLKQEGVRPGRILHWWLGDEAETAEMLRLGCYFSVNYSMVRSSGVWSQIPLNRILLETDHPSGDRFSVRPRQPGSVIDIEAVLASKFGLTPNEIRLQCWRNFVEIVDSTETQAMMPIPVQRMIAAVRSAAK
ncbi:TatD family hydrolase [Arthrobacter sp. JUb115]|uniref:TatD family hydrolase n=1 Tax=Arthrobacter sp. JUb115 TaxID=2485108 RepID=UPI00105BF172|nr:TatD family hydrolase [Arthrobacter sp. JUb115]TDU29319.1 TatD DNase family protein [Arthrobacter sp. JUb115]